MYQSKRMEVNPRQLSTRIMTQSKLGFIPDSILEEIFLRLPVKPLYRFKSLSKNSYLLISSPFFSEKYRKKHIGSKASFLMAGFFFQTEEFPKNFAQTDINFVSAVPLKLKKDGLDPQTLGSFDPSRQVVYLVASSNGFLLCRKEQYYPDKVDKIWPWFSSDQIDDSYYLVCNPMTGERVALPRSPNYLHCGLSGEFLICHGSDDDVVGSSLDCVSYKVVHVWECNYDFKLNLEIFSSQTGEWTELQLTPENYEPLGSRFRGDVGLVIKGETILAELTETIYDDEIQDHDEISNFLVFNINQDSKHYRVIPSPGDVGNDLHLRESPGLIQCMEFDDHCSVNKTFKMCELKEEDLYTDDEFCWVLKYRVNMNQFFPRQKSFSLLSFHPLNETEMLFAVGTRIVLFDMKKKSYKQIYVNDPKTARKSKWLHYKWSLLDTCC